MNRRECGTVDFPPLLLFAEGGLAALDAGPDDGRRVGGGIAGGRHARMVAGPDGFGNLGGVATVLQVLLADGLLDAVHLVLVALAVPHGALLGLLKGRLQCLIEKTKKVRISIGQTHFAKNINHFLI